MASTRSRRRVDKAVADGRLVRVARRQGWDRLDGVVLGSSDRWLLMATETDAGFVGHSLVRVADVRRVERRRYAEFEERALGAEGHWPLPRLEGVDLSCTRTVLSSLGDRPGLVTLFYERDHADECQIGRPRRLGRKRFRLQPVDPGARWEDEDVVFRYSEISRIEVGGAYERRLAAFAGPPPS